MEKHIITYFETIDPTTGNTISNGYNIGQKWFNSTTGEEYIHKSDGVWIPFSLSGHTHEDLYNQITGLTETKFDKSGGVLTGGLTGTTFVKSGGTIDQYLMADGSTTTTGSTQSYYDSRYVNVTGDTINGNLTISGTTNIIGNISGTTFYGSGAGLTDIPYSGVTKQPTQDGWVEFNSGGLTITEWGVYDTIRRNLSGTQTGVTVTIQENPAGVSNVFDELKELMVLNSSGGDAVFTFPTSYTANTVTYIFIYMDGSSTNVLTLPNNKTLIIMFNYVKVTNSDWNVYVVSKIQA